MERGAWIGTITDSWFPILLAFNQIWDDDHDHMISQVTSIVQCITVGGAWGLGCAEGCEQWPFFESTCQDMVLFLIWGVMLQPIRIAHRFEDVYDMRIKLASKHVDLSRQFCRFWQIMIDRCLLGKQCGLEQAPNVDLIAKTMVLRNQRCCVVSCIQNMGPSQIHPNARFGP